jgi:F0F1-type ATP synthase assembly protein I
MYPQSPKKKPNKWLALINIPIQMGVVIFLFSKLGTWLDEKYPNPNTLFVKICTLTGVALAFYNINRQLKEINKMDNNEEQ